AGWTDGSNAWRPSVYGLSSPKPSHADDSTKPYCTVSALSHRQGGRHSQSSIATLTRHTASLPSSSTEFRALQSPFRAPLFHPFSFITDLSRREIAGS
ncbi:hypothetical protein K443DRAFT_687082, partial [Laccaria amethystina LaAM-08-1]